MDEKINGINNDEKIAKLKIEVYEANIKLKKSGLAILTWGNASAYDRELGLVAIKPSGVSYDSISPDDIVLLNIDGHVVSGNLRPSSDTETHLYLYRNFESVSGIVHTHSSWATIYAQMGKNILCLGTTHADVFYGDIPCTRELTSEEIKGEYEKETGKVIVEHFEANEIDPKNMPAVIVNGHAPFVWGSSVSKAVENAIVLENVAMMAWHTQQGQLGIESISQTLLDKHFLRKHGKNAYYGQ